jgi:hypothetical protein
MRSAFFCDIAAHIVVIPYWRFGTTFYFDLLTLEDGTDMFSRNVGMELPLYAG